MVALMAFNSGDGGNGTMDSSGGPAGYAGDPAGGGKTCGSGGGCHTGAAVGTLTGVITSNIPAAGYVAGTTYTVTANFVRPGHSKFGFQITPQKSTGALLGTLATLTTQSKLISSNKYITHTSTGTGGSGSKTWNFKWTAPATGQGPVTFYGVFNATNSSGGSSGDSIFKSTMAVTENTTAMHNFEASDLSFSTFPNPTHDNVTVKFILTEPAQVEMSLFDIHGNTAGSLFSEQQMSGEMESTFDISSNPPGIYFLRLNVNGNYTLQKVVKF